METREIPFKAIDRAFVYNAIDDRWEENNVWNGNIVSEKNLCNLPLSLIFGCSENNRNSNKSIRKLWWHTEKVPENSPVLGLVQIVR